jgi:hypothetical protein
MSHPTSGESPRPPAPTAVPQDYREALLPAWWIWLLVVGLAGSCALVATPVDGRLAVPLGTIAAALTCVALLRSTPVVRVDAGRLRVGRATIPLALLGEATPLDRTAMRNARGPGLDARAFLCLRGWIPEGVRIEVRDPADPTPYWLVSSRRPEALAHALTTARQH